MKFSIVLWLVVVLLIAGCGAPKTLVSYIDNAETEAAQGNYAAAVESWKLYFGQHSVEETEGRSFAKAAKTAFLTGNNGLAQEWFDQARYKNYAVCNACQDLPVRK